MTKAVSIFPQIMLTKDFKIFAKVTKSVALAQLVEWSLPLGSDICDTQYLGGTLSGNVLDSR